MKSHFSRRFLPPVVFHQQADPPGAGGAPSNPNPLQPSQINEAVDARIADLLGSKKAGNDPTAALEISVRAQYRLEQERDRLLLENTRLTGLAAPADAVVLTGDDKKAWETLSTLGTGENALAKATTVKTAIEERNSFEQKFNNSQAEISRNQRDQVLRDVAEDADYKFSVLADRDRNTPGLEYLKKPVTVDGKTEDQWFVKFKDGEGDSAPSKEQPLVEYAESKWADYLPALRKSQQNAQTQDAPRHLQQGTSGTGAQKQPTNVTKQIMNTKYQGPPGRTKK